MNSWLLHPETLSTCLYTGFMSSVMSLAQPAAPTKSAKTSICIQIPALNVSIPPLGFKISLNERAICTHTSSQLSVDCSLEETCHFGVHLKLGDVAGCTQDGAQWNATSHVRLWKHNQEFGLGRRLIFVCSSSAGVPVSSRVSAKIQQLVNTLKRPKRPPLREFFVDDFEELLEGNDLALLFWKVFGSGVAF